MTKQQALKEFKHYNCSWPEYMFRLAECNWITWDQYAHWR